MVSLMTRMSHRAQTTVAQWARRFARSSGRYSFRIALVVFFGGFILFNTRSAENKTKLAADRMAIPQSSYASPAIAEKPRVYAWLSPRNIAKTAPLCERIEPPTGYERLRTAHGSFGDWLRHLPTWPADTPVTTAKRKVVLKPDDKTLAAVIALQPGSARVLDASNMLIRLRAEYLWAGGVLDNVQFHFTSGHVSKWSDWAAGKRPAVKGRKVDFHDERPPDASRDSFCSYLETIFQFSSPYSILDDTRPVEDGSISPGDIFLNPALRKGYALIVLDVAHETGNASAPAVRILLGTGGTPPQTLHVLRAADGSPWFAVSQSHGVTVPGRGVLQFKHLRRWK